MNSSQANKLDWIMTASLGALWSLSDQQKENVRDFGIWLIENHWKGFRRGDEFLWRLYNVGYFDAALDFDMEDESFNAPFLYDFIEWQQDSAYPVKLTQERLKMIYGFVMGEYRRILLSQRQISLLSSAIRMWGLIPSHLSRAILDIESQRMEDARKHGETCSVCNQLAKEYKVRFSVNMAVFLRSLVINYLQNRAEGGEGWIHYKECTFSSRNYPYVAYWNLATTRPDPAGRKRTSGEWKPTQKGIDFIFNRTRVPLYCYTYNGAATGFDNANEINISEAFGGEDFDLSELMGLMPDQEKEHG